MRIACKHAAALRPAGERDSFGKRLGVAVQSVILGRIPGCKIEHSPYLMQQVAYWLQHGASMQARCCPFRLESCEMPSLYRRFLKPQQGLGGTSGPCS